MDATDFGFVTRAPSSATTEFKNNIITNVGVTGNGIYSTNTNFAHTNNIVHTANPFGNCAGGAGAFETTVNPLLVNPGAWDYRLQATSPAIDAGINVGLPFEGLAPDLGAYEYASVKLAVNIHD